MKNITPAWLKKAVFYQIYPQSFNDSNSDGIGDINGIIQKLDYIQDLGVNALWLNPCFVSPFQDAGYDVEDYYQVAPRYGTNADLKRLFDKAHSRGIKVCLDLIPGHTSIEHEWFKKSSQHKNNKYSDRYIWTDSIWDSMGDDITFINGFAERDGNYAINFFYCQPALNYGFAKVDDTKPWQQSVDAPGPTSTRNELKRSMDFWLKQGADGFRVDMASSLIKNDKGHKATIKLWREIRKWMKTKYPETILIAEWGNPEEAISAGFDVDFMIHFGVSGYEYLLLRDDCFFRRNNGMGIKPFLDAFIEQLSKTKGKGYVSIPSGNHDFKRMRSDERTLDDLKVIYTLLITLPGIPFIYYGDEIGMHYINNLPSKEGGYDRTGTRTPMQWDNSVNAGFSDTSSDQLYLPIDSRKKRPTVESQVNNPRSLINHIKNLIKLRKNSSALQADGKIIQLYGNAKQSPFVYLREDNSERYLVAVNPANIETQIKVNKIKINNSMLKIGRGIDCSVIKNGTSMKMEKVSYAVYKL